SHSLRLRPLLRLVERPRRSQQPLARSCSTRRATSVAQRPHRWRLGPTASPAPASRTWRSRTRCSASSSTSRRRSQVAPPLSSSLLPPDGSPLMTDLLNRASIFVPITSITKADGGRTRIVTGVAASERLDQDGQRADYDWAKSAFGEWYDRWGNIREQHGA